MARNLASGLSGLAFRSYLVTPAELYSALKNQPVAGSTSAPAPSRIVPLCAAYFLPNDPQRRTGPDAFRRRHIPSARFFDIDGVKDEASPYPHMVPTAARFAQAMGYLGISKRDTVVVYDSEELGIFSAPRVGWTLRLFGHQNVHVLNNFKIWAAQGYPTASGEPERVQAVDYGTASLVPNTVATFEEMKALAQEAVENQGRLGHVQVLDARSQQRWAGLEGEPRPGIAAGHIPGSQSFPFQQLLDPETQAFLSPDQLRVVFESHGIDPTRPIISTCGSGVTAAIIDTALAEAYPVMVGSRRLYDGSWAEWGRRLSEGSGLIGKAEG